MANRSEIVNFYAVLADQGKPLIFTSPVPIEESVALGQVNRQRKLKNLPALSGPALWASFDMASRRLYLPQTPAAPTGVQESLIKAIEMRVQQRFGGLAMAPPIHADPGSFLRVVRSSDFPNAWDFITRLTHGQGLDLPVVQADLSQMVQTAKSAGFETTAQGGYVGTNRGATVNFTDGTNFLYLSQKTPFILINLSDEAHMTSAHKERIVLTGYREGLGREAGEVAVGRISGSEFFSIEFLIYIGWPIEHLCHAFISKDIVAARQLIEAGLHLILAAKHMASFGYRDVTTPPHYYSFKAGEKYPLAELQNPNGVVEEVKRDEGGWVVLKSGLALPDEIFYGALGAAPDEPVIRARYQPNRSAFTFEDSPSILTEAAPGVFRWLCAQGAKDSLADKRGQSEYHKFSVEVLTPNAKMFQRRRILDYPQTADLLKKACAQFNAPFQDMEVLVGPWQKMMGMAGGYLDKDKLLKSGEKMPWEPVPGLPIYPPVIMVDEDSHPTAADQASTLVHEYWHYLYFQVLHFTDTPYDAPGNSDSEEDKRKWFTYLSNPTERISHIQQMKYMLSLGMTKNEIILSRFMGQKPTLEQLPQARKYAEYVDAAMAMLAQEREDEPFSQPQRYNQPDERATTNAGGPGNPQASGDPGVGRTRVPSGSGAG